MLPIEKLETFKALVQMRNFIVHQYFLVNYELLHESLHSLIRDFEIYKNAILMRGILTQPTKPGIYFM